MEGSPPNGDFSAPVSERDHAAFLIPGGPFHFALRFPGLKKTFHIEKEELAWGSEARGKQTAQPVRRPQIGEGAESVQPSPGI